MSDSLFNNEHFAKLCTTTVKAAKGTGTDTALIKSNVEKLFNECQRLANIIQERENEYEVFQTEKKSFLESNQDVGKLVELQQDLKSKDAEIAYLEAQIRKKDDENIKLKAEKEMLLIDSMNSQNAKSSGQLTIDSIKRYESVIESLNKKIQYLEIASQKS